MFNELHKDFLRYLPVVTRLCYRQKAVSISRIPSRPVTTLLGQRYVFLGHGRHSRATTRFMVSVPRQSRSREEGRTFHLRRRVFDLRRWTFAPRSRSVVGGRVDHRQLSLRRAEIGGVLVIRSR